MIGRRIRIRGGFLGVAAVGLAIAIGGGVADGQKGKHSPPPPTSGAYIALRDAFVDRIGEDGFYCRLPAPAMVVADTPLFGRFDRGSNNIVTPDWTQLTPAEKSVFTQLAGAGRAGASGGTDAQAQKIFEVEAHQWIFIVQEVHWWEACKQLTLKLTPYQAELQAVRVALAYWRERDPEVVERLAAIVESFGKEPSLIPPGQDLPTYFNQHYLTTGSGQEYLWLQAQVVKVAMADPQELTLVQAMKQLE
jgi:hypothetical protein